MAYDITQLKQDIEGMMHGTTLNSITGVYPLINRAARQVLMDVDPQETKRIIDLPNAIYSEVYDYPCPVDLKGNKVIDLRPQVNRSPLDQTSQTYNEAFDVSKQGLLNQFTINFNTGVKTLRISNPFLVAGVDLNQCDAITDNGTWTVGGTASDLTANNVRYASGNGSLQFNLAAGANPSEGYLENNTMNSVDLSNLLNQGVFFLYTYLPTPSEVNSVKLRWGTDSSNYYEVTATTTQQATSFETGWNLIAFNWLGATVVGIPDPADIQYLRVTWNYDGTAQTAVGLDNIVCRLGSILEIEYYSKYMFRDASTGAFQETVTADSNLINLDTETYNLLTYQCALLATQQQAGAEGASDTAFFIKSYNEALRRYKAMYKSEIIKPQGAYYAVPKNRPQKWVGFNGYR